MGSVISIMSQLLICAFFSIYFFYHYSFKAEVSASITIWQYHTLEAATLQYFLMIISSSFNCFMAYIYVSIYIFFLSGYRSLSRSRTSSIRLVSLEIWSYFLLSITLLVTISRIPVPQSRADSRVPRYGGLRCLRLLPSVHLRLGNRQCWEAPLVWRHCVVLCLHASTAEDCTCVKVTSMFCSISIWSISWRNVIVRRPKIRWRRWDSAAAKAVAEFTFSSRARRDLRERLASGPISIVRLKELPIKGWTKCAITWNRKEYASYYPIKKWNRSLENWHS